MPQGRLHGENEERKLRHVRPDYRENSPGPYVLALRPLSVVLREIHGPLIKPGKTVWNFIMTPEINGRREPVVTQHAVEKVTSPGRARKTSCFPGLERCRIDF
jgi:hypothetical protein